MWRHISGDTMVPVEIFAPYNRLRAAGVSFEDRQDLLGHKSGRITTHYSAPDLRRLIEAVETLVERRQATVLRIAIGQGAAKSRKTPAS